MKRLTYAERLLSDGAFFSGMTNGLSGDGSGRPCADYRAARRSFLTFRRRHGYTTVARMLTRPESQPKLGKSDRYALGLMLVPANGLGRILTLSRPVNVCPRASKGCAAACLSTSGHGAFDTTQKARAVRMAWLLAEPRLAGVLVGDEVRRAAVEHGADNVTLRLNVLSDIRWERLAGVEGAADILRTLGVRLYDYTAWAPEDRAGAAELGWHLTYSAKESAHTPDVYLASVLSSGSSVAMPFTTRKGEALPEFHVLAGQAWRVIDGDKSDDRTEDPRGVIVGLRAKGRAGAADTSGFIRLPIISLPRELAVAV